MCSTRTDFDEKASALKESPLRNRSFEKLLLDAVDEALSSLGDTSKRAVYYHLEKTFDIKKQDIPYKIEEFANAIEKIFGLGTKIIEIQIMKNLYEKVGPAFKYFPERDLVFTDYVAAARSSSPHTRQLDLSLLKVVQRHKKQMSNPMKAGSGSKGG